MEPDNYKLVPFRKELRSGLESAIEEVFPKYAGWAAEFCFQKMNPFLSRILLVDNKIAGFYLLRYSNIEVDVTSKKFTLKEDLSKYRGKQGIEGIALGILPKYKNKGYGKVLRSYPRSLGYDYIWGEQLKDLNNLNDWLKIRRLVAENEESYVTLQDF